MTKIAVENDSMEVVDVLWEALGEEVPEEVRLRQLSRAMYKEDKEEAKKRFSELLGFLTPELVRVMKMNSFFLIILAFSRLPTQGSTAGEVCFKMPSLKEKLISFVFCSHMGRSSFKILDGVKYNLEEVWCPAFKLKFTLYYIFYWV